MKSLKISIFLLLASISQLCADNWPRFLGQDGLSHSPEKGIPTTWGDKQVQWSVDLPDIGQSCPIIWGNDVFLTSSNEDESKRFVHCIDKNTGKMKWTTSFNTSATEKRHRLNTPATASCATEGNYVVAFFGPAGLHCLDTEGEKVWSKQLGDFPGFFRHGSFANHL